MRKNAKGIIGALAAGALAGAIAAPAAAQVSPTWLTQFGGSASDEADALAPDGSGGVFAAGATTGSLGGPWAGARDAWVARYDEAGNRVWITQFGTSADDPVTALAPDSSGGAFVGGWTAGSLGGPSAGTNDEWLTNYDGAGNQRWIIQFGTSSFEEANALAPDGSGGVFAGGRTGGSLGSPLAGGHDAWLARYDGAGNQVWMRQFGTSGFESTQALAPEGSGDVFAAGRALGSLGGPWAGLNDVWLARYDGAGNQVWMRQFGTSDHDTATAVASDGSGGVLIAGWTEGSLGGPFAGGHDAWLARYDGAGTRVWMRQFGTGDTDQALALASDDSGGAFIAGRTEGSLGGPSAGGPDAWVARYDEAGNRVWITQFGTSADDFAYALAPDGSGGAFATGFTRGSLGGASAGGADVWLARFPSGDACYADCDGSGDLDFFDFLCFQNAFAAGDPYADCDSSGALDFFDFLCFQNAFAASCP